MGYMPTHPPIDRLVSMKLLYKLTPSQALALDMLMERQLITAYDLIEGGVAPTNTTARTILKRLRAALADKVEIESKYAVGYWINPEIKHQITDELIAFNYPRR